MGRRGDVIEGPMLGQKIVFEATGEDTNGELTICHHIVEPKGVSIGPPEHIHLKQEEHYRIISGRFGVQMRGVDHVLGPGEDIVVPAGVPHLWWNEGSEQAHVILEFRPAQTIDAFFETLFGLSRDGKLRREEGHGHPKARPTNILQAVAISYDHGIWLCDVPAWIQRIMFPLMAFVGRLVGIRGSYAKYRGTPAKGADAELLPAMQP